MEDYCVSPPEALATFSSCSFFGSYCVLTDNSRVKFAASLPPSALSNRVSSPQEMVDAYDSYSFSQKKDVMAELVFQAKQKDILEEVVNRISTKPTARDVLKMFDSDYVSNRAFLERLFASTEVTTSVAPRAESFSDLSKRYQSDIGSLMAAVALKVANILYPNDGEKGSAEVLQQMLGSRVFRKAVLPDVYGREKDYQEWTKNPIVRAIHDSVSKLGKKDYEQRKELLSVLLIYPQVWIRRYFDGVGRKMTRDAKGHMKSVGAGLTDEDFDALTRNRRCCEDISATFSEEACE